MGLIWGFIRSFIGRYAIVIGVVAMAGMLSGSFFVGYKYNEGHWQKLKAEALMQEAKEKAALQAKIAEVQTGLAKAKRNREVVYREKIKLVTANAPDCRLDDAGMQELVCAVRPSDCQRRTSP